ncbi:MAG: alpha/beta hydrolase, partial [Sphingomonadales bacterium]|nr:alpha/beta hydrolase [Sphingomonadales bacterium]
MARIEVGGLELDYELIGDEGAPPLMLTPGGRYP